MPLMTSEEMQKWEKESPDKRPHNYYTQKIIDFWIICETAGYDGECPLPSELAAFVAKEKNEA
jgi:hypothetical protein